MTTASAATPESLAHRVYRLLSDRHFHSGTELAARCEVSRSAVWKAIAGLRKLGVVVDSVERRGYRLPQATALLDAQVIRAMLPPAVAGRLRHAGAVWSTGSTNADLMARTELPPGRFDFLAAEYQSAGRGRRARSWLAPPGGAICLSLGWSFASLPASVGALSLAIGVCALRALRSCAIAGVELKWPNDLVSGGAKLGGILAELRAEAAGPAYVVIGIGLNVVLGPALHEQIKFSGTQATDLAALTSTSVDRNRIAAALVAEIVAGLQQFEQQGFAGFIDEWRAADALAGKPVRISLDASSVSGHARGIDANGALCVQTREGLQRLTAGDASVRAAA